MDAHSYMKHFSIIHRFSVMYHIKALKQYNIHGHQMGYIYHICRTPGLSQEDLASCLRLNKASVAKGLRYLISEGYVRRVQNQRDRRAYQLFPTEKAKALDQACTRTIDDFEAVLTRGMTEEEKAAFQRLVTKACENVMRESGKEIEELEPPVPPGGHACRRDRHRPHRP